jgi:hypothetical protein
MDKIKYSNRLLTTNINNDDFLNALESFIDVYKEERQKNQRPSVPLPLFADKELGILEVIVKYTKENLTLTYSQIAIIINRDQRTVWTTYHKAIIKHKEPFKIENEEYNIPCEIFIERSNGPLETLVVYLKENLNLSFKQISSILNRDYRTIWISYKNGKKNDR